MKVYALYDAIFDKTKCVQMRNRKTDSSGAASYWGNDDDDFGDWVTITPENPVTGFMGSCLTGSTELLSDCTYRIIENESHDGTIVELQGRKYLLKEVKDI